MFPRKFHIDFLPVSIGINIKTTLLAAASDFASMNLQLKFARFLKKFMLLCLAKTRTLKHAFQVLL